MMVGRLKTDQNFTILTPKLTQKNISCSKKVKSLGVKVSFSRTYHREASFKPF